MCLLLNAVRYKFVLALAAFLALANIFMVVNYQFAKHCHKKYDNDILHNDQAFFGDLRRLQIEINKTFERFEDIKRVAGRAFDKATLYKRHHRRKPRKQVQSKGRSIPLVPDCKQPPFLLIMIHSTPANIMEREAIRLSWGRPENSINKVTAETQHTPRLWKTVFLLGQTLNSKLDRLLHHEANIHGDIVFGDFIDTYRNLTLKMVFGIQWASRNCQAEYIMKADADSYVNVHKLTIWLKEYQREQGGKPLFLGAAMMNSKPFREPDNKFYVSEEEYPYPKYPPYAQGPGYVFSGTLLTNLSKASKVLRLFPNEDACFGALMQYIKVNITDNERFVPFMTQRALYWEHEGYSLCRFNGALVIHRVSGKLQIQTHVNVLVLNHVPTICEHIKNGIGDTDYKRVSFVMPAFQVLDDPKDSFADEE